ncbi:hypothetical protein JZ751_012948 [Albula glossodonta]|uniref:Uncharacterized protein n=1 Tax=Albula glossodonta TaxID=121402 RepID=A0A8T2N601_9TELE|nr:hypothetical protein JZ751_012948 [Albula glossodonta]
MKRGVPEVCFEPEELRKSARRQDSGIRPSRRPSACVPDVTVTYKDCLGCARSAERAIRLIALKDVEGFTQNLYYKWAPSPSVFYPCLSPAV